MSERDQNRERMPIIAAWVDQMRELFGEVRVNYVNENGIELGKRGPEGVVPQLEKRHGKA